MKQEYYDIIQRLGKPLWWDEVGCPRYAEFDANLLNNIYAREGVLLLVKCQSCGAGFAVALSGSTQPAEQASLREKIEKKIIHYGDPPNSGCCSAGPSMTSEPQKVLQYWHMEKCTWKRDTLLEIDLA